MHSHGARTPKSSGRRLLLPLVELRSAFALARSELDAAERGATDLDLDPVIDAAGPAALAEDGSYSTASATPESAASPSTSPHEVIPITDDYDRYPEHVAKAVAALRAADIAGPYADRSRLTVLHRRDRDLRTRGYPVIEHLRQILGGPVVWAPAVEGAMVLSQRGGDFELTVGEDFSIGYLDHDDAWCSSTSKRA